MKKTSALEFNPDRMVAELEQLVIDRKQGNFSKYRITQIEAPTVQPKTANEILLLREKKIRMSRAAFAKVLNVPKDTLRAWEKGSRNPSGAAVRLLDIIGQRPKLAWDCIKARKSPTNGPAPRLVTALASKTAAPTEKRAKHRARIKNPGSRKLRAK